VHDSDNKQLLYPVQQ